MRHVDVDQHAVVHDLALGRVDEAHAAHVGRELVDLVEGAAVQGQRGPTVRRLAQIQHHEFVGRRRGELVGLAIHTAYPIALRLEPLHQMAGDEPASAADQCSLHDSPIDLSFAR